MVKAIKQIGLVNLVVAIIFVTLGVIFVTRVVSQPVEISTVTPAEVPVENPIVEENKKPGTDDWKSPNLDSYLAEQAEADRLRRASETPAPADAGGWSTALAAARSGTP